ncbi:nucleotidyltransferase substrate binding protein [Macromonas nakdongensis]|uniref:nucleotidyltransferase substrate binding protein n=1 Tax=Macromonas nakdongensis TaxID=1843082 RepID=UPI000C336211|nr:nucleotidyltransferase substrate binding protein [Macromonas nakdongensis]
MTASDDIRWQQRLANFGKALARLSEAVELAQQRSLSDLEKQGLVQAFEFTHELAWNVMKDYFVYQGHTGITGSRDAIREAFKQGLVQDGEGWMETIKSRNQTSHTYNQAVADDIAQRVCGQYHPLFIAFHQHMQTLAAAR